MVSQTLLKTTQIYTQKIGKNLLLRSLDGERNYRRPLVVMFGWWLSKRQVLDKYGDIYLQNGYDVIAIPSKFYYPFFPSIAGGLAEDVLRHIENERTDKRYILHAFSMGVSYLGKILVKLTDPKTKYPESSKNLRGQILESPMEFDLDFVVLLQTLGVSNRLIQSIIRWLLIAYFWLFRIPVTRQYFRVQKEVHDNKLQTPSLFLYATNDVLVKESTIHEYVKHWKKKDVDVRYSRWEDETHCALLYNHPGEYKEAVEDFLRSIIPDKDNCLQDETGNEKLQ